MDFSKLLQHCRDEHGIEVDTSVLTEKLLSAIWEYFSQNHDVPLLHTQQWDALEQLQNQPKPGNPPPIVATVKRHALENIESGEGIDDRNWSIQHGVLISNREALEIVKFCERASVPDQLPDANGFPTGFFDMDGDMICVGDVLEYPNDPGQSRYTVIFKDATFRQMYHHWEKGREDFPALNQTLLANRKIVARAKRVEQLPDALPNFKAQIKQ